jgi:AAA+ superfamily predicted ATPase
MEMTPDVFVKSLEKQIAKTLPKDGKWPFKNLFYRTFIPDSKKKNALSEYAEIGRDEFLLFLFDDTFMGSAKEGLLITDKNLYYNINRTYLGKNKKGKIPLEMVYSMEAARGPFRTIDIKLNNDKFGNITCPKSDNEFKFLATLFKVISSEPPAKVPACIYGKSRRKKHPLLGRYYNRETEIFDVIEMETSLLYRDFEPLLKFARSRGAERELLGLVIHDLKAIFYQCAIADGELDLEEMVAYQYAICAFLGDEEEHARLEQLKKNDPYYTQMLLKEYQRQFRNYFFGAPAGGREFKLQPFLMNLYQRTGTNHYDRIMRALFRFASVVIKANGRFIHIEEAVLKHLSKKLHQPLVHTPTIASYGEELDSIDHSTLEGFNASITTRTMDDPRPAVPVSEQEKKKKSEMLEKGDEKSLKDYLKELDQYVGMKNIKSEVRKLTNYLKVERIRQQKGLSTVPVSLHSVFFGPPGTGKTTVARLLGNIFRELGFLEKGHLVETDRAGMVAGYVGQTAGKVDELVKSAADGVLFVDEAYSLASGDSNDFGQEAVDTMLKRMEDMRNSLIVIVAGYPDEMKKFIETNPGLKSRFNRFFNFKHYNPEELVKIFKVFVEKARFEITPQAEKKIKALLEELYQARDKTFGNGRLARNIFEKAVELQANRIAESKELTDKILTTLTHEDIPGIELMSSIP